MSFRELVADKGRKKILFAQIFRTVFVGRQTVPILQMSTLHLDSYARFRPNLCRKILPRIALYPPTFTLVHRKGVRRFWSFLLIVNGLETL